MTYCVFFGAMLLSHPKEPPVGSPLAALLLASKGGLQPKKAKEGVKALRNLVVIARR